MAVSPVNSTITVATPGTKVQFVAPGGTPFATSVYFEAAQSGTNTGLVFVGTSSVSANQYICALAPGQGFNLAIDVSSTKPSSPQYGPEIALNTIFFDAATAGNKIRVTFMTRLGTAG